MLPPGLTGITLLEFTFDVVKLTDPRGEGGGGGHDGAEPGDILVGADDFHELAPHVGEARAVVDLVAKEGGDGLIHLIAVGLEPPGEAAQIAAGVFAATGLRLFAALKQNILGDSVCWVLAAMTFIAIALLRVPLVWVLLVLGGAGALWAYRQF